MLSRPALAFLNHLLTAEDWARDRLAVFAGHAARLEFGNTVVSIRISGSGLLEPANAGSAATVTIRLPADAPARALTDRTSLLSSATIAGSAEMAETLGLVFRNVRWDVEGDLAQVVGDVVARRAVRFASGLAQWHAQGARNLAGSAVEYLTEEDVTIASRRAVERFAAEVDTLRDDLARFEKRVARAEVGEKL